MAAEGRRRSGRQQAEAEEGQPASGQPPTEEAGGEERGPPRRSGRHASTPAPESKSGKPPPKTAPAKPKAARASPSASPRPASAPAKKSGPGKSRFAAEAGKGKQQAAQQQARERSAGGKPLRKQAVASMREASEDEEVEGDGQAAAGSEDESSESEVDETIYRPPAAASLPAEVLLQRTPPRPAAAPGGKEEDQGKEEGKEEGKGEGEEDGATVAAAAAAAPAAEEEEPSLPPLSVPSGAMGELLAAYTALRAFSWQLRLSPFSFQDFAAAMLASHPTVLVEEVHLCVLRALAVDETPTERADHQLDLQLLDTLSWPCFVWEWLRLTDDPLLEHMWGHRLARSSSSSSSSGPSSGAGAKRGAAKKASGASDRVPAPPARRAAFQPLADQAAMDAALQAGSPTANGSAEEGEAANMDVSPEKSGSMAVDGTAEKEGGAAEEGIPQQAGPAAEEGGSPSALPPPKARQLFAAAGAPPPPAPLEYYALPVAVRAAVLARLCDQLLDCTTVRAEIDRREGAGQVVAGKGGRGGAFPVMTEKERQAAEDKARKAQQSDANADACALCGLGGSLICCDGCPAAYHMRCVGESYKGLSNNGDWMCPECSMGGRGEAAGLRIPVAARNKWKQPLHLMHGMVARSAPPAVRSSGKHAEELEDGPVPVLLAAGDAAKKELGAATRVRPAQQDELPHPTSYEAVDDPPEILLDPTAGPEGYVNKYRNGWPAAIQAITAAVEDAKRRKHRGGIWVPTGTCGHLPVAELPAPLTLSKFSWVQLQGRPAGRLSVRCGKCPPCLRPSMHKGCLNPVMRSGEEAALAESSKLGFLIAYVVKVERELWGLAEGPWAGPAGMQFRQQWANAARSCTSVSELARLMLQFEASLRPVATSEDWHGGAVAGAAPPIHKGRAASAVSAAASRAVSRAASVGDMAGMGGEGSERPGSTAPEEGGNPGTAAAAAAAAARASDPYDTRFEQAVKGGWEVDRRHYSARAAGVNRLPSSLVRKAARQSGWQPIPGLRYRKQRWSVSPRMRWVAATEAAHTTAQLAVCLRQLDAVLQWDTVAKPRNETETPFFHSSLLRKRPAEGGTQGNDYLLQLAPPPVPTPAQQQHVAAMFMQQQQILLHQQRMAAAAGLAAAGMPPMPLGQAGGLPQLLPQLQAGATGPQLQVMQQLYQQRMVQQLQQALVQQQQAGGSGFQGLLQNSMQHLQQQQQQQQQHAVVQQQQQQQQQGSQGFREVTPLPFVPPPQPAEPKSEQQGFDWRAAVAGAQARVQAEAATLPQQQAGEQALPQPMEVDVAPVPAPQAQHAQQQQLPTVVPQPQLEQPGEAQPGLPLQQQEQIQQALPQQQQQEEQQPTGSEGRQGSPPAPGPRGSQLPTQPSSQAISEGGAWSSREQTPEDGEEEGKRSVGSPVRRCGTCVNCLNPQFKKACQALAAERSVKRDRAEAQAHALATEQEEQQAQRADDPAWLAAQMTSAAFQSAVEADAKRQLLSPDAPAAMAAKLRARQVAAQQEAASLPDESLAPEDDLSLDKIARLRARHNAATLARAGSATAPGGGDQAAGESRGMTTGQLLKLARGSAPQPVWAHESLLPLWLVREYEERLRREGANAAAREAVAVARRQMVTNTADTATKDAARRAVQQAAAAAADACGICGVAHGDDPELDDIWICCDTCNRWFHGACVRLTQEDVDAMGGDEQWDCLGCTVMRRKMERVSRRNERASKPPELLSPGDGSDQPRRGRPPKPLHEKADYKRQEAKALAQLEAGKRSAGGRRSGAGGRPPVDPEEAERRQQERLKRKREQEGQQEVWCQVCRMADRGRPLAECASCHEWYHAECAGTTPQEILGRADMQLPFHCLGCQGKRARPPSQAAVDAAVLAAAAEGAGSGSGGGGIRLLGQAGAVGVLADMAAAAGVSRHTEATWLEAAQRVLTKVGRLACARHFLEPVDLDVAEGYLSVVQKPMDLGTVQALAEEGRYASPLELLADVQLVWANCAAYNDEESEIVSDAQDCDQAFGRVWQAEGLPPTPQQWQPARAQALRQQAEATAAARAAGAAAAPGGGHASGRAKRKAGEAGWEEGEEEEGWAASRHAARGHGAPQPPAAKRSRGQQQQQEELLVAVDWQQRALRVLQRLMKLQASEAFHEPVPRGVPGYHAVIKQPRCLEGIERKLAQGKYPTPSTFLADVQLVWDNCRTYNEPEAPVVAECNTSEAAFRQYWKAAQVEATASEAAAAAAAAAERAAKQRAAGWKEAARKALYKVSMAKESTWFQEPVPLDEVPDYLQVVAQPMDLGTISARLRADAYRNPAQFLADMALVWDNCLAYNGADHEVTADSQVCRVMFERHWQSAGLALDGGVLPPSAGILYVRAAELEAAAAAPSPPQQQQAVPQVQRPKPKPQQQQAVQQVQQHRQTQPQQQPHQYPQQVQQAQHYQPQQQHAQHYQPQQQQAQHYQPQQQQVQQQPPPQYQQYQPPPTHYQHQGQHVHHQPPPTHYQQYHQPPQQQVQHQPQPQYQQQYQQQAAPVHQPPVDWASAAQRALGKVQRESCAWPFLEPVPAELVEYYEVIQHPIDLGTISQRLRDGQYPSPSALLSDAQLMFTNCAAYNPEGDQIFELGRKLKAAFVRHWQQAGLPLSG